MEMEKVCRTCMRVPDKLLPLFEDDLLPHKIATISAIKVLRYDNLPSKICEECVKNINLFYNFRKVIRNTDLELRERFAALERCGDNTTPSQLIQHEYEDDIEVEVSIDISKVDLEEIIDENLETPIEINEDKPEDDPNNAKNDEIKKKYNFKNILTYTKKNFECKSCNFSCTELSKWHNHKRTKHYPRGVCSICGKSMRADNLNKHVKAHTESPVTCSECGKVFKNSESLRGHLLVHTGPELICHQCGKVYKYRGEYNRHIKRHLLNGRKTVKCPLCDKMFFDKRYIKKHMQTHTGERPYVCQYCRKGFSSGYALKTHTRQHTNEKPYICEYCPMAFPQKVSLMTHIKSKHANPKM